MANVSGTTGNDTIQVGSASAGVNPPTGSTNSADTISTGNGDDSIDGGGGGDSISAGSGYDTILGSSGNDTVDAGTENDSLSGGDGNDSLYGAEGDDQFESGAGNNTLAGGGGADVLICSSGHDSLSGGIGADFLDGGGGNDTISGGLDGDFMRGNFGNDRYYVDNVGDTVQEFASEGLDVVYASITYTLTDNVENLVLTGSSSTSGTGNTRSNSINGNAQANRLSGLSGNDTILGGSGNDTITGGSGADRLGGDSGDDIYDYNATSESTLTTTDTITSFTGVGVAGGDRIDLSTIDANTTFSNNQAFILGGAFVAGHLRVTDIGGGATLIEANTDNDVAAEFAVIIEDGSSVSAADYSSADFIL